MLHPFENNEKWALFCVFDGHAGYECADKMISLFPMVFAQKIKTNFSSDKVPEYFISAYSECDQRIKDMEYVGCTATTIFIWQDGGKKCL